MIEPTILIRILIFGAVVSGIWALVSSGFSLIVGVSRILNFAHGTFFVLSAYVAIFLSKNLNLVFSSVIGVLISGFAAISIFALIRRIREHEVMVIIVTLAIALLFEQILLLSFGQHGISLSPFLGGIIDVFGTKVTYIRILSFFVAILVLSLLEIFINRTKIGKMIVAVSEDAEAAMLMGINVDAIFATTMFLSGILAGISGIFYAQIFAISPKESLKALIYAFAIVILGGLGNLRGSIIASFIIGYVIVISITFMGARWSEFAMLLSIILVLIIKPTGIFGVEE